MVSIFGSNSKPLGFGGFGGLNHAKKKNCEIPWLEPPSEMLNCPSGKKNA